MFGTKGQPVVKSIYIQGPTNYFLSLKNDTEIDQRTEILIIIGNYIYEEDIIENKHQRIPKGQSKMDNPEKRVPYGTQDKEKQNTI